MRYSDKDTLNFCQLLDAGFTRPQAAEIVERQIIARRNPEQVRRTRVPAKGPMRTKNQFHQPYRVAGTTSLSPQALLT